VCKIALTVAQNVSGVVITSSPGPTPAASRLRCNAAVQELTAATCETLRALKDANCASNAATLGPLPSQPDCIVATTSWISASWMSGAPNTINGEFNWVASDICSDLISTIILLQSLQLAEQCAALPINIQPPDASRAVLLAFLAGFPK